MNQVPLIEGLTPEQFRQKLAGLLDPREQLTPQHRQEIKDLAIKFVAVLPAVFGEGLDRLTMWEKIASALEVAFAKTAGADHEFFIEQVMKGILADRAKASANQQLAEVIATLEQWGTEQRHAWINYFGTHLVPVLVHARNQWTRRKEKSK